MVHSILSSPGCRALGLCAVLAVGGNLTAFAEGAVPAAPAAVFSEGDSASSPRESELVYANSYANALFPPGPGWRIADDLWTTAMCGCALDAYELTVGGGGDGTGPGFSVEFALYDACPNGGGAILPGTADSRTFDDDGIHVITFNYEGDPLELPGMVWLAAEFDRYGAGWFTGTPADVGFTTDDYDYPTIHCVANFFGTGLWAGFAAKVFCTPAPPPQVADPTPPDGAENLSTRTTLTWNGLRGSREGDSDEDTGGPLSISSGAAQPGDGQRSMAEEGN